MIRTFFLIIFVISAVIVYMERDALIYGVPGYLSGEGKSREIRKQADLSSPQELFSSTVKVEGIPDYKNTCSLSGEDGKYTCFRILDFSNRLTVCTSKGLETPEGIDEVIQPKTMRGRLVWLNRTAFDKTLRSCLKKSGNISLSRNALVLLEGRSSMPSIEKVAVLGFCLLLACFSLYRVVKP